MPNSDTTDIRNKARRVKGHILTKYLKLADRVDEKGEGDLSENEASKYWQLTQDFAKNVIPRSQEITGEDGGDIKITSQTQEEAKKAIESYLNGNTANNTNEQSSTDTPVIPV